MNTAVPEIFGDGLSSDVLDGEGAAQWCFIELKTARVVGEEQFPTGNKEFTAGQQQITLVAVNGEGGLFHLFGVAKGGRVANDKVVLLAALGGINQILQAVFGKNLVLFAGAEVVVVEIAFGPLAVGLAEVNGGGLHCAASDGVDGEGGGIGEEVEEAFGLCPLTHHLPGGPMVEEEAGVQIVAEVDFEVEVVLLDDADVLITAVYFILRVQPTLDGPLLDKNLLRLQIESGLNFGEGLVAELGLLYGRFILRAFIQPDHRFAVVPIHDAGIFGDVSFIEAVAGDVVALGPFLQMFLSFSQAIGEHLFIHLSDFAGGL